MDNPRPNGGASDRVLDDVDRAIIDIVESDAPPVTGDQDDDDDDDAAGAAGAAPDAGGPSERRRPHRKRRSASREASSSELERKKRLRVELLELQVYHSRLQCRQLERELQLGASQHTKEMGAERPSESEVIYLSVDQQ